MAKEIGTIRNIATAGHGGSGKTTLVEAMLHKAGATKRLGRVDDGSTVADFDVEEKERKFTIDSALVHCGWKGKEIQLIDSPGYPDFISGMISSFTAVEAAVICVSALKGVELNTRKAWDYANRCGIARAFVITKMDVENASYSKTLEQLVEVFGQTVIPYVVPIGEAGGYKGVINAFSLPEAIPAGVADAAKAAHDVLVEKVIEADEEVMMRYLDGEEVKQDELAKTLATAFRKGVVVPVFCAAGAADNGAEELLDAMASFFPSPLDVERKAMLITKGGEQEIAVKAADPEFSAFVFKSMTDPFVGKMNFFRVFSGTVTTDVPVYNSRTGKKERLANLYRMQGKEQEAVTSAGPGDLVCVAKVEDVTIADTLCADSRHVKFPTIVFPKPMVSLAVEPKSRGDEQKIGGSLSKLADEDPTFSIFRDTATKEMIILGMSTLHLDVMINRLKRRFDVEVTTKEPDIAYKETVTSKAEAMYRHKKQTGGRGQFGEVYLRIEPRERGAGFEFLDEVVGGSVPNQFIPAVEKGAREQLDAGVLAGYPVVDIAVALYDGSFHPVDSSEQAFKTATRNAFQKAFLDARPVLLEPIANIEITVPSKFMGDITSDLNGRRGRVSDVETIGGLQIIKAQVPLAEIAKYSTELRSMTAGEGSYTIEFSHYDVVPSRIQEQVVAKAKARHEAEKAEKR